MTTITRQRMALRGGTDEHTGSTPSSLSGEGLISTHRQARALSKDLEATLSPIRKAAIVLISLEQSAASDLLSQLDRAAVEAVTWEIARIDNIDPEEQEMVLEEFFSLGLRRHYFVFDDLLKMQAEDIRRAYNVGDVRTWALALATASPPLRTKVLEALQPILALPLSQTLQNLGPFRLAEAEAAQMEVTERFRELSDQGVVILPEPIGRDDLLV